ncbi:MAG: DUF427 domain-containing protein, partial [Actinobacteria bacterium]|nr:DUF427 domain-containing protein [Actinomycetota bacterium]
MINPLRLFARSDAGSARRAVARDTVVAEADETQRVDGYDYFPPEAVNWELLEDSEQTSVCPWKGVASYYDVVADGERHPAAAWSYQRASDAARHIAG